MTEMTTASFSDINTTDVSDENDSVYYDKLRKSLNTMSLIVYWLAFVLGGFGNGVIIFVTGFKMKKTVHTVWVLNLAVAGFLFTAFLPFSVAYLALGFHWPFGKFMCKLKTTIIVLNMFASVYFIVVISVDRCVSVVWPVWARNHRNVRKATCVSLGVWVLALMLSAPYFVFRDTGPSHHDKDIIKCFYNFALSDDYETPAVIQLRQFRHQAMIITRFLLGFVVPFTVIVSCYAVIIHRVRRNRTLASQSSRTFKIIAAIIITFFLCWAPFHIMKMFVIFTAATSNKTLQLVVSVGIPIASNLAFLSSWLNTLVHVFIVQDFKNVCKSFLNVLGTAIQEEEKHFHIFIQTVETSESKEKSADTEV